MNEQVGEAEGRRLRPLALALVLPVLVLLVGGGMQLRAHFAATAGPAANPLARADASIAYDDAHGVVVMFGGVGVDGVLADTWTWDGQSWTRQHPAVSPSAREGAAMAYDPASRKVVLLGGFGARRIDGPLAGDTWTWDGSTWHRENPRHMPSLFVLGTTGSAPLASDPGRHQLILVADSPVPALGMAQTGPPPSPLPPTAVSPHSPLPPTAVPPPSGAARPVPMPQPVSPTWLVTPIDQRLGTFVWSGGDWVEQSGGTAGGGASPLVQWPRLVWDAQLHAVVMLAQNQPICSSVEYSYAAPPPRPAPSGSPVPINSGVVAVPPAGHGQTTPMSVPPAVSVPTSSSGTFVAPPCAASNPSLGRVVRGQCDGCPSEQMWTWDGSGWRLSTTSVQLPPEPVGLAADPAGGGVFGGDGSLSWVLSHGHVTTLPRRAGGPTTRFGSALVGDLGHGAVLLFGGRSGGELLADTWTWDGTSWTHRAGPLAPQPTSIAEIPPRVGAPEVTRP